MDNLSIYLRGFEEEDYILINQWRNDPKIQELVSCSFRYVSKGIEREWVKSKMMDNTHDIYLAICLKSNDKMIGYYSINNINYINRSAEGGGIVIDPAYQDGIIRHEVGLLARKLVFDHLNLNRYEGSCLASHTTSRIMMEATGYRLEGVRRQAIFKDGHYHDQCIYSLLREDYNRMCENDEYSLYSFSKKVRALRRQMKTIE